MTKDRTIGKSVSRRTLIKGVGAVGAGLALGGAGKLAAPAYAQSLTGNGARKITIAWSAVSVCHAPLNVALKQGFFDQYGLAVERVNHANQTDALLQSIATGHADGGIGMTLRWLKPLEQGFDVNFTLGTHGGCMRLLVDPESGIESVADLRGKAIGVTDRASPELNFFAIRAKKAGIENPFEEIEWIQYPADLFAEAVGKGEVQGVASLDPHGWIQRERYGLKEVGTNLDDEYADSGCCVLGLNGTLARNEPEVAAAITRAFVEAHLWAEANPDETAEIIAPDIPAQIEASDISAILRSHTHGHSATGERLRADIARFATELKLVEVLNPTTDPDDFASKIVVDVNV